MGDGSAGMRNMYDQFVALSNTDGNEPIRCSRMHFKQWAERIRELLELRAEVARLQSREKYVQHLRTCPRSITAVDLLSSGLKCICGLDPA